VHYKFIAFTCYSRSNIPPFAELIGRIKINKYNKTKMMSTRIPKKTSAPNTLRPVIPLIGEKSAMVEDDKGRFITIELRARVNALAGSATYKKYIRKFEEGTAQEWIDLQRDIKEIWVQNTITGGTDRASTARALLRGESLTSFESSIEESRRNDVDGVAGVPLQLDAEMVETTMTSVATTVCPHRALEMQRLWMTRGVRKPYEMTTRKTAAAITRINNALPLFPSGTDTSKFSDAKVVELLEWSLPPSWRSKFDLDGYILPTLDSKAKLIESCEAIERNQKETPETKPTHKDKTAKSEKSSNSTKKRESGKNDKYCSEHGKNNTHNTSDCFTLKNRKDKGQNGNEKNCKTVGRSFSNRNFRKELNVIAKHSSKKEALDLYASAIIREQTKYDKAHKKKASAKRKVLLSDSEVRTVVTPTNHFI
jgi:Tfp pilus assembly protein PilE